jgi:hypothetical protein
MLAALRQILLFLWLASLPGLLLAGDHISRTRLVRRPERHP